MKYNLNEGLDRQRFRVKVEQVWKRGGLVELTDKRQRTLKQNAYLHLCLGCLAMEIGESVDFVKREVFKKICNREMFVVEKDNPLLGKIETLRSTADPSISVKDMSIAIDRYRKWCADMGVYIPEANENENLASLEAALSRYEYL